MCRPLFAVLAASALAASLAANDGYSFQIVSSSLMPKGALVAVVRAGKPGPGEKGYEPVLKESGSGFEVALRDPGPCDLYLEPKAGKPVRLAEKRSPKGRREQIKIAELLGAVRVRGDDLPRAANVVLTDPRDPGPGAKGHAAEQEAGDYKSDLPVRPGTYTVWVVPANGARAQKVAEKVKVQAGKVTTVPQE